MSPLTQGLNYRSACDIDGDDMIITPAHLVVQDVDTCVAKLFVKTESFLVLYLEGESA